MNLDPSLHDGFADARPVAQHCAELVATGPCPEERKQNLAIWCRDIGHELAQELPRLLSGGKLHVSVSEPEMMAASALFERIGNVAANSLLRVGSDGQTMLFSLDFATAIALTDSSFGGEGGPPESVPEQLPRSAVLMVDQFAQSMARLVAVNNGSAERGAGDVLVRSDNVARLKPFAPDEEVALFTVIIAMGIDPEWQVLLAAPTSRLDDILPSAPEPVRRKRSPDVPGVEKVSAVASMPLCLHAVLSEFDMPLSHLEHLRPGDEILLKVAREVPLCLGDDVFAHGILGTVENRMALRLTRIDGGAPVPPAPFTATGISPQGGVQ